MIHHQEISDIALRAKIRHREACFGGNALLKIYGRLGCGSGKRLKKQNRVFFSSALEAEKMGYRPCGNCMKSEYKKWKDGTS